MVSMNELSSSSVFHDKLRSTEPDMRGKLLEAAIEVFARHGFAGASTRMLARAAGANQQAIPYYFGSKQGLYLAAAEHIGGRIQSHIGPVAGGIRARLAAQDPAAGGAPLSPEEARALLAEMLKAAARLMVNPDSAHWARFLVSEQMEPTEAFERIYRQIMAPLLATAGNLVGILLGEEPDTETVRLRTVSLLGQILVLRVAHAAVMRQLGWNEVGAREVALIDRNIEQTVAAFASLRQAGVAP